MDEDPQYDELRERIRDEVASVSEVLLSTGTTLADDIARAAEVVIETFQRSGRVLICGNGGSAADSQHMAAELVSSFSRGLARQALSAIALTTDSSILTAYSNDFDFEGVYARQVEAHGRSGDTLIVISTSGQSSSVIMAAQRARHLGLCVVALTGSRSTVLHDLANVHLAVPSTNTQHIQMAHLLIEHLICQVVDDQADFHAVTSGEERP